MFIYPSSGRELIHNHWIIQMKFFVWNSVFFHFFDLKNFSPCKIILSSSLKQFFFFLLVQFLLKVWLHSKKNLKSKTVNTSTSAAKTKPSPFLKLVWIVSEVCHKQVILHWNASNYRRIYHSISYSHFKWLHF